MSTPKGPPPASAGDRPFPFDRCAERDPRLTCQGRRAAVRAGEFVFDHERGGWIVVGEGATKRVMSARARYFFEASIAEIDGQPWQRWDCPWCGEPLAHLKPTQKLLVGRR